MAARQGPGAQDAEEEKPFDGGTGFFAPPRDNPEPPGRGRVFAAFEVPEEGPEDKDSSEPIQLECIDAEWFDRRGAHLDWVLWFEPRGGPALSVLEFVQAPKWLVQGGVPGSTVWYQVDYESTSARDQDGLVYRNLFETGTPVRITEARRIESEDRRLRPWSPDSGVYHDPELVWKLEAHGFYHEPWDRYLQPDWVARALGRLMTNRNSSKGVAVYDVGQGNWQAILHGRTGKPFAYVDVGGGVLYNRRTFPKDFEKPPAVPLVILSHWDWDHWSSAARFRSLLEATWIAPSLSEKPIQRRFALDIMRHGSLLTLPAGWTGAIEQGCLRIEGCSGRTENDRGLAVTAFSRRTTGKTCLLPGDAAYRYIPSLADPAAKKFDALCMSHHGGRLHSRDYPAPERRAVAVNSAGPGNTYRHPLFKTLTEHKAHGWPMPIQTGLSGSRPCHVHLPWGKRPQLFHGSCDMTSCTGLSV